MPRRRSECQTNQDGSPVGVQPLGGAELGFVRSAMADLADDWSVELHDTRLNEAALLVVPDDGDDAAGPSFVIRREDYGLRLDQVHWDVLTEVGIFASLEDVVETVRTRLALCAGPSSVTLH